MKAEYIAHMGSDNFVANVARVSFGIPGGFDELPEGYTEKKRDGLIEYLAAHNHWTPFAHPMVCMRLQAPVPIRTQCFKHKVGFVENEESRRYISTTPELFVPDEFRNAPEGNAKQGSSGTHSKSDFWKDQYQDICRAAIAVYDAMILDKVAPEQARMVLPQGCEVNWIWTGSLAAWARVYKQRSDPHAQQEIRELSQEIDEVIRPLFPVSWSKLVD